VTEAVEDWATMPIPDLISSIQLLTVQLYDGIKKHAADEGAYQRTFWAHWQTLSPEMSVAAQNRQCEWYCSKLDEERAISRGLVEAMRAKQESMLAILSARVRA
jgi:hypothetical protein